MLSMDNVINNSFAVGESVSLPGSQLESSIESTARMMAEHKGDIAARLAPHLDALLAEQLRQVGRCQVNVELHSAEVSPSVGDRLAGVLRGGIASCSR